MLRKLLLRPTDLAADVDRRMGVPARLSWREHVWAWLHYTSLVQYRFWRRWLGGRWEAWWIGSPINGLIWMKNRTGKRPALGEMLVGKEEYS